MTDRYRSEPCFDAAENRTATSLHAPTAAPANAGSAVRRHGHGISEPNGKHDPAANGGVASGPDGPAPLHQPSAEPAAAYAQSAANASSAAGRASATSRHGTGAGAGAGAGTGTGTSTGTGTGAASRPTAATPSTTAAAAATCDCYATCSVSVK